MVGDKDSDRIRIEGLRSVILGSSYTAGDPGIKSVLDIIPLLA